MDDGETGNTLLNWSILLFQTFSQCIKVSHIEKQMRTGLNLNEADFALGDEFAELPATHGKVVTSGDEFQQSPRSVCFGLLRHAALCGEIERRYHDAKCLLFIRRCKS
jgi:hypothetical protein